MLRVVNLMTHVEARQIFQNIFRHALIQANSSEDKCWPICNRNVISFHFYS